MSKKKSSQGDKDFLNLILEQREKKKVKKFKGTFLEYLSHLKDNPDIADEIEHEIRRQSGLLSDVMLSAEEEAELEASKDDDDEAKAG